jgi:hypothetical protein
LRPRLCPGVLKHCPGAHSKLIPLIRPLDIPREVITRFRFSEPRRVPSATCQVLYTKESRPNNLRPCFGLGAFKFLRPWLLPEGVISCPEALCTLGHKEILLCSIPMQDRKPLPPRKSLTGPRTNKTPIDSNLDLYRSAFKPRAFCFRQDCTAFDLLCRRSNSYLAGDPYPRQGRCDIISTSFHSPVHRTSSNG